MDEEKVYSTSFRVGILGIFAISIFAAFDDFVVGVFLMALWVLATLFVLPIIYIAINKGLGRVPDWILRSPHQ